MSYSNIYMAIGANVIVYRFFNITLRRALMKAEGLILVTKSVKLLTRGEMHKYPSYLLFLLTSLRSLWKEDKSSQLMSLRSY